MIALETKKKIVNVNAMDEIDYHIENIREPEPCVFLSCCGINFHIDDSDPALEFHLLEKHNGSAKILAEVKNC